MATPGGFLIEADYVALTPIWQFYEAELFDYLGGSAAEAERLTYAFAVGASQRLPPSYPDSAHWSLGIGSGDGARTRWVLQEFYAEEEAERKRCCEQIISRSPSVEGEEGPARRWWEGHPEYQEEWERWFGGFEGHWAEGVYHRRSLKELKEEEEEGK